MTKSPIEKQIIEGLDEVVETLESPGELSGKFDGRLKVVGLKSSAYDSKMVKQTRESVGASQSVFAAFLGVSRRTVQAWESGDVLPSKIACRFMDEIKLAPESYRQRLEEFVVTK